MNASDLRQVIVFQNFTTVSDSMGGRTATDVVAEKTVRAKIVANGADVSLENGQNRDVKFFTILCRFQKDYAITKKTRILWDGRLLTPNAPINIDSKKIWMTFEATENG